MNILSNISFTIANTLQSYLSHINPVTLVSSVALAALGGIALYSHISPSTHQRSFEQKIPPDPNRDYLIEQGIIHSPEKAKEAFWSLGKQWWKQIIDGQHHKHGSMVFDEGLHEGKKEPGYLSGVEAGSRFFSDHFDTPFSIKRYKEIHRLACLHFPNSEEEKYSGVSSKTAFNEFRSLEAKACNLLIQDKEIVSLHKKQRAVSYAAYKLTSREQPSNDDISRAKEMLKAMSCDSIPDDPRALEALLLAKAKEYLNELELKHSEYVKKLNSEFIQFANRTGLKGPLTECKISEDDRTMVFLIYFPLFPIFLRYFPIPALLNSEQLTNKLILEFHQNLRLLREETTKRIQAIDPMLPGLQGIESIKSDYQERAIRLIAQLYAELEWIHPWHDGQGRTDLISLNGLLCQEAGLHPCILEYPYFSSSNSVDAWVDYLKAGLQEFKKAQKLNSPL